MRKIRDSYFTRKNGAARQFDIKLYNALLITKKIPSAIQHVGVSWVDNDTFKVNSSVFSQFLGIKGEPRLIFHKQGAFSRHGFEKVYKTSDPKFAKNKECGDVDDNYILLYTDPMKRFSKEKSYCLADITYRN